MIRVFGPKCETGISARDWPILELACIMYDPHTRA